MGTFFFIIFVIIALLVISSLFFSVNKKKVIKKNSSEVYVKNVIDVKKEDVIEEGMLFDPETGCLITLEQAQSGIWNLDDCKKIDFPNIEEAQLIEVIEYFKKLHFKQIKQNYTENAEDEYDKISIFFQDCQILKKYENWFCSDIFEINNHCWFIILNVSYKNSYEQQILLFLDKTKSTGHYHFLEDNLENRLLKLLHPEKDIILDNYITNTIEKSRFTLENRTVLSKLKGYSNLDIELFKGKILIKSKKPICIEDARILVEINEKLTSI